MLTTNLMSVCECICSGKRECSVVIHSVQSYQFYNAGFYNNLNLNGRRISKDKSVVSLIFMQNVMHSGYLNRTKK